MTLATEREVIVTFSQYDCKQSNRASESSEVVTRLAGLFSGTGRKYESGKIMCEAVKCDRNIVAEQKFVTTKAELNLASTFRMSASVFDCATAAPPIEVFQLGRDFQADTFPEKVSLGVGAYR